MKLRHLLPILNTLFLAAVAGVFVQSHGGVKGDYTYLGSVTDAPTEPGDYGRVFFNRWQFYGDRETALTQSFLFANIPGFGAAKAALWILRNTFEEFQTSYPFGLSYASYSLLLGFPFSLLQWFGIGALIDWLRSRSAPARTALTLMVIWLSAGTATATTSTPVGQQAEWGYDGRPSRTTVTYLGVPTEAVRSLRTEPCQFTGKERDAETGLDYFGARYMSAAQGRFTSPDPPLLDQHIGDPQSWNIYSIGRNNPLRYIDPTGNAIELLGSEDDRKNELEFLKQSLGNKKAASRLYINSVGEGDDIRYFVGISGDVGDFMKLSATSHDLADIVENKNVVEFGLTTNDLSKLGGAATYEKGEVGNTNVRVLVNPAQMTIADRNSSPNTVFGAMKWEGQDSRPRSNVNSFTPGIAAWHELGHAWGYINGRIGVPSNKEAVDWENRMREQVYGPLGPRNARRIKH